MYAAAALAIIEAVATYVADQYAQRQQDVKFEKLRVEIINAIQAAKAEIIAALREINDSRVLDGALSVIEVYKSYDRKGDEYKRLQDIISVDGVRSQFEIERRMHQFPAYDIGFHRFFFPWMLVTCARAFSYIELTVLRKAEDFDDALRQFEVLRDECEKALAGLKIINDRRFSASVHVKIDKAPGEGGIGEYGYFFDDGFVAVDHFSNIPFKRVENERARASALAALATRRAELFDSSNERKAIQSTKDQACKHVKCN